MHRLSFSLAAVAPLALGVLGLLGIVGCNTDTNPATTSSGSGTKSSSSSSSRTGARGSGGATSGPFNVRGSVEQVDVWNATAMALIELHDANNAVVQMGTTDKLGSYLFRKVPAGMGYSVVLPMTSPPQKVDGITVVTVAASQPAQNFYANQNLKKGFNYITTRDGTTLSAYVTFPAGDPPYATVVDYSGYNPSQPGAPIAGAPTALCPSLPVICDSPNDPSAEIAAALGFATVSVNMRGTGCSGGAYDYFEELQLLDGYDTIEAVAAQDWVLGHRVAMTGLSYPGISQLFVASTHPPSLAAITPLSVIGNTYTTARPGGIFNDGFALGWITSVVDKADPYGQGWEQGQVATGDNVCKENQLLHGQKANAIQEAQNNPYYVDSLMGPLNPSAFVNQIDVPVFLAGAFEDEQTGPYFFNLLDKFTNAPVTRFSMYNGVHPDGFAPQIIVEWEAFLDIYLAHKVPVTNPLVQTLGPQLFQQFFQVLTPIPPDRFASYPTWAAAKTAYEAEKPYRAIFEDGAVPDQNNMLGGPMGTFEMHFSQFPPTETTPTRWYFQTDGSLQSTAPTDADAASSFNLNPQAGHTGILAAGGNVWDPLPDYDWPPPPAGNDVVFETPRAHAGLRHARIGERRSLDSIAGERRRYPSEHHGSATRRAGDVHPKRLAAREPPQARRVVDRLVAAADVRTSRRTAPRSWRVEQRARRHPRVQPRVPKGFEDPRARRHAGRQPRGVDVRPQDVPECRELRCGARRRASLEHSSSRARRCSGDDASPALPVVARGAVPDVRALYERRLGSLSAVVSSRSSHEHATARARCARACR